MSGESRKRLPLKLEDLHARVRECIASGKIKYTRHALEEMEDDAITHMEIKQVLLGGHHKHALDLYDDEYQTWNYRFHGFTAGGERELGVLFSLESESGVMIITAFERTKE